MVKSLHWLRHESFSNYLFDLEEHWEACSWEAHLSISIRIEAIRKAKHFSLRYVAKYLDMSTDTYLTLERGRMRFRVKIILSLMDLFNVGLDEIFGDLPPDQRVLKRFNDIEQDISNLTEENIKLNKLSKEMQYLVEQNDMLFKVLQKLVATDEDKAMLKQLEKLKQENNIKS